jgi:hypothetical protein
MSETITNTCETYETIHPYQGNVLKCKNAIQFFNELELGCVRIHYQLDKDGNKRPTTYHRKGGKVRGDYCLEHKNFPHTSWNVEQCKAHSKWIMDKQLPTNRISVNLSHSLVDDINGGFIPKVICIDFDSEKEWVKFINRFNKIHNTKYNTKYGDEGDFPYAYTLSCRKKLPHLYMRIIGDDCDNLRFGGDCKAKAVFGKDKGIDWDIMVQSNVFEDHRGKVYGSLFLDNGIEFCEVVDWLLDCEDDKKKLIHYWEKNTYKDWRVLQSPMKKKIAFKKSPQNTKNTKYTNTSIDIHDEELQKVKIRGKEERIPFMILKEVLYALDVNKMDNYEVWYKTLICVANQVLPNTDPIKYLKLFIEWTKTFPSYKDTYDCENYTLFKKVLMNSSDYHIDGKRGKKKKISCKWLWKCLYEQNREMWVELNFHDEKNLEAEEVYLCNEKEWFGVFKRKFKCIKTQPIQYCYYNPTTATYTSYTKDNFLNAFEEFYVMSETTNKKTGEPILKKIDCAREYHKSHKKKSYYSSQFLPSTKWLENDEDEKIFNYWTGYDINKTNEYDEEVNELTKEQLETELNFIFTHLRNLCGRDKNDAMFEYMLKYYAHLFKYPSIIPRVAFIITTDQRVGKNQFFNFIASIIGMKYYLTTQNIEIMIGQFNSAINNKLFINPNEFEGKEAYIEKLKVLISEKFMNTTKKFHEAQQIENYVRLVCSTNQRDNNLMKGGETEGRFVVCRGERFLFTEDKYNPSKDKDGAEKYDYELNRQVNSLYIQKCFYRYLTEFVKCPHDYNFGKNRVFTKEYMRMKDKNTPPFVKFLMWGYSRGNWDKLGKYNGYMTIKEYSDSFKEFKKYEGWTKKNDISFDISKMKNEIQKYVMTDEDYEKIDCDSWVNEDANSKYIFHNISPKSNIVGMKVNTHRYKLMDKLMENMCIKNGLDLEPKVDTSFKDSDTDTDTDDDYD